MQVDATMFFSAESSLSDASKNLINAQSMASGLTSFPPEFEKVGDINQIISDLSSVRNDIGEIERKISNTKDQLCKLSTGFAIEYYQSAMNKFGDIGSLDMSSLSTEEQQYIEMNQKMFNDYLFTYLDKLNSENNLPDEYRDIYNSLKDFKELEKVNEELSRIDKALDDMVYLTDGYNNVKPTDIDRDEFGNVITTKEERGNRYLYQKKLLENMKKELLVKQEALQRATGTYQNKWYEDIWESMQKTGAAWANVYTTFTNGGSAGEVISAALDATKQTVSTGAVCVESAYSGFKKVKEWVGDGIVATGGTLAAGATWLFHDTWSDNDLADDVMDWWLDYVRTDQVGEARKQFYENNIIGKWNNENSNLKYDSAGAMAIYDASSFAGKAILATGATIATGPAGAVALGALYGAGKSSEEYSQSVERENGENYNYAAAIAKTVAGGVVGASEFYGYGQMGSQIFNGLGALSGASTEVVKEAAKEASTSFGKNFAKNFLQKDTFLDSAAVIVDHGANFITGEESGIESLKNAGIEFGIATVLNAAGAGLSARAETKAAKNLSIIQENDRIQKELSDIYSGRITASDEKISSLQQKLRNNREYELYDAFKSTNSANVEYIDDNIANSPRDRYLKKRIAEQISEDPWYDKKKTAKIMEDMENNYIKVKDDVISRHDYFEDQLYVEQKHRTTINSEGESVLNKLAPDDPGLTRCLTSDARKKIEEEVLSHTTTKLDASGSKIKVTRVNAGTTNKEIFLEYILGQKGKKSGTFGIPGDYNFVGLGDCNSTKLIADANSVGSDVGTYFQKSRGIPVSTLEDSDRIIINSYDVETKNISMHTGKEQNSYSERLVGGYLPGGERELVHNTINIDDDVIKNTTTTIMGKNGKIYFEGNMSELKKLQNSRNPEEIKRFNDIFGL